MLVRELMTSPVITLEPSTSASTAAALLLAHGISGAPVVDDFELLVGFVSEIDLEQALVQPDPRAHVWLPPSRAPSATATVADVMVRDVVAVPPTLDVAEAVQLMMREHVRSIPVISERRVVGIISRRDILRTVPPPL